MWIGKKLKEQFYKFLLHNVVIIFISSEEYKDITQATHILKLCVQFV